MADVVEAPLNRPSKKELFVGFLVIGLSAFGGALPWARREIVEKRRWLEVEEFNEALAMCQFIPGPNVGNLAILIGQRFHGVAGATAAVMGIFGVPFCIVLFVGAVYTHYANVRGLHGAIEAMACVGAGLMIAMAYQLLRSSIKKRASSIFFSTLAFICTGPLELSLPLVLAALLPLAIVSPFLSRFFPKEHEKP